METVIEPRLLVVGGTGFIGQHVIRRALRQGWNVTCLGLNSNGVLKSGNAATYIAADLTDAGSLRKLGSNQYDFVVNLGGYVDHALFGRGGRALIDSHFNGLLNLLEVLDRSVVRRFVQIGSSDEYGDAPAPQHEGLRESPISPYSLAKTAATQFLQMLQRMEGFPAVILRLFLTYGPGQDDKRFIPQIIKGCLRDVEFPTSGGEQLRDFCYVDDTVDAIFLALGADLADGEILNVGSGEPVTIRALIEQICSIMGRGRPQFGALQYRAGENMALYADARKIESLLGWKPRVGISDGLNRTVEYFRREHGC